MAISPFQLRPSLAMQHLGHFDPTVRQDRQRFQKVHLTPAGAVVVWQLAATPDGLRIDAFGAAGAAVDGFAAQFPLADGAATFRPAHPVLRRLARAFDGLRLLRVPWPFDVAAGAVLQQRVRWQVASNDFRRIAQRWGTHTLAGTAFPSATQLAAVPVARLEAFGIDPKRARALGGLARAEASRPFLHDGGDLTVLRRRLLRIPGIGPWTTETIVGYAFGDSDAVPVGDLHLPSLVTSALTGEDEGTDERMLELLEPYRGQRFRVVRLLAWAARRAPHLLQAGGPA